MRYEFRAAASPEQAAAVLQATPPDFLVVDSEPSAASVIPWCRSVCHHHRPRYFYTLLLVADPRPEDLQRALEAGVDDFLPKPIRYVEVMVRLRAGARVLELERRLTEQSGLDPLTGLLNRPALEREISRRVHGQDNDAPPDACVLADIDFLEGINVRFGRPAGDAAIRALGDRLRECLPPGGFLAHFGAGRFAALLPTSPEAEAARWAESVRAESVRAASEADAVPDADHDDPTDGARPLTASFAVLEIARGCGMSSTAGDAERTDAVRRMIARATGLMQAAKQAGRNHVLCASQLVDASAAWQEVVEGGKMFAGVLARDVMTPCTLLLRVDQRATRAAVLMSQTGLSAIPVIAADGTLAGVVMHGELLAEDGHCGMSRTAGASSTAGGEALVADVMQTGMATLPENATFDVLRKTLTDDDCPLVVIVCDGRPTGIVTAECLATLAARLDRGTFTPARPFVWSPDYLIVPDLAAIASPP